MAVMTKRISALSQAHQILVHASTPAAQRVEQPFLRGSPNLRSAYVGHSICHSFKVLHLIPTFEIWVSLRALLHLRGGVNAKVCQCLDVRCQLGPVSAMCLGRAEILACDGSTNHRHVVFVHFTFEMTWKRRGWLVPRNTVRSCSSATWLLRSCRCAAHASVSTTSPRRSCYR
jgi:hypothetical protein